MEYLKHKQAHGTDALIDLFDEEDLIPTVNINKKNYGIGR